VSAAGFLVRITAKEKSKYAWLDDVVNAVLQLRLQLRMLSLIPCHVLVSFSSTHPNEKVVLS